MMNVIKMLAYSAARPEVTAVFDIDQASAAATRHQLLTRLA
jgi:hypothetical protein